MYTSILWITLFYALGACSQKRVTQNIRLNKALVAGAALSEPFSQAMSVPLNDTALVPTGIDLNQVLFPVLIKVHNDSLLEDINSNNVEIYLPEIDEIEQSMVDGTIDSQKLKTITNKGNTIKMPIEEMLKGLPIASITFAANSASNLFGAGWKYCFGSLRKKKYRFYSFSQDHAAHLNLVKGGTYLILMSVALYLELQQGFQRADLLTIWSNAGVSLMTAGVHLLKLRKKQPATSGWHAFSNTASAIIITSVSPDTPNYHPKMVSSWFATSDQIAALTMRICSYISKRKWTEDRVRYEQGMIGRDFFITSFSIAISSRTTIKFLD
ncbi:hypothetical protein [Cardinium endosymbiont of Culicoides punctatus]|uniref:hypothetical protein n=1 Tax=Cardinium endosymbiont of Culicoides punctatus TaxID=2304601 RepID=UPI0010588BCD|nr:hypothetical protein [Cardinium endosymbiont of Culicoides punctatus]